MNGKAEFLGRLNNLLEIAKKQGSQIMIEEVKAYFSKEALTEEQMELVFDYLLAQKIVVKGYIKPVAEKTEEFTEEENQFLKEYLNDLAAVKPAVDGEVDKLYGQVVHGVAAAKTRLVELYLKEVVEIAKEMHQPEVFLGDLIQEGNLGAVLGVEMISDSLHAHEVITTQIRQSIQMLLEEQAELSNRDKKMVEKVTLLDEAIQNLAEELGRKVSIDELAIYMGMEIEEIEDILKLTGEEGEEEK